MPNKINVIVINQEEVLSLCADYLESLGHELPEDCRADILSNEENGKFEIMFYV